MFSYMRVSEALETRKSVRAFTNQSVEKALIKEILTLAGNAPSGANTQPWITHVLMGESKDNLQAQVEDAFRAGKKEKMDYQYYPLEWSEPFRTRRKECGLNMYSALSITRKDKQRQQQQWAANYRAFDAPVMLLFSMDGALETGSYLDFGLFLQSVMLLAIEFGLATCPQVALVEYPSIIKPFLKISSDSQLVCGMAMGYEDKTAKVNSYRTARKEIADWVTFLE